MDGSYRGCSCAQTYMEVLTDGHVARGFQALARTPTVPVRARIMPYSVVRLIVHLSR
jgi:hypothetical protein